MLFASFLAYFTGNVTIGLIAMVVSVFALLRVCHFDTTRAVPCVIGNYDAPFVPMERETGVQAL